MQQTRKRRKFVGKTQRKQLLQMFSSTLLTDSLENEVFNLSFVCSIGWSDSKHYFMLFLLIIKLVGELPLLSLFGENFGVLFWMEDIKEIGQNSWH